MRQSTRATPPCRVVYVVNVDWFFFSHRLPLALAAREAGCKAWVIAQDTGASNEVRKAGFEFIPAPFSRHGLNPLRELRTLLFLLKTYRRLRPDLVHHVTIKPVIHGSVTARVARVPAVVNAITGLGFSFGKGAGARMRRTVLRPLLKHVLHCRGTRTIFQNPDDLTSFIAAGLVSPHSARLIRGSGVDCVQFSPAPVPEGDPVLLLASRMLWSKGIQEFVDVANVFRQQGRTARFVLVGSPDPESPEGVPEEKLTSWNSEGVVEWWGHRSDMPHVLRQATVVVLPTTYPEGVPKVLLEAAASGRPIVASDVPGCREIVRDGVNGLLVPLGDGTALADALETLLEDEELRRRFGQAGREIALAEFSVEQVVEQTVAVYRELLGDRWPSSGPTGGYDE